MAPRITHFYVRAIIFTSLVWFLVDVLVLMYFTDSQQTGINKDVSQESDNKIEEKNPDNLLHGMLDKLIQKGPGENGTRVNLSKEELIKARNSFEIHQFNLVASEKISLNRSLPDMRIKECQMKIYPDKSALPTTSIIIVFHNEAWSTLLRTVHSAINRSPHDLLEEIILVDDDSQLEHLGKTLEDHVEQLLIPVRILRFSPRIGAIVGRIKGAEIARGETLTFLDSHCECTDGWLEPLLFEVYKDRTSVISPRIDTIDNNSFRYRRIKKTTYGGFTWTLRFVWEKLAHRELLRTSKDPTLPVRAPTIAGGLFTINKDYFFTIGSFDKGMEIWGSENLDISWRTWLCHGTLLISPCSRVGHVFRQQFYFKFPGKGRLHSLLKNKARLAEVWMDEWKDFFYKVNPKAKEVDHGNLTERLNIKHSVKCKSFKWYLENIYPEMLMPLDYNYLGQVTSIDKDTCLQADTNSKPSLLDVVSCGKHFGTQVFCFTKENLLMSESRCVEYTQKKQVRFQGCNKNNLHQKWFYNKKSQHIVHIPTKMCLDRKDLEEDDTENVVLSPCKKHDKSQIWLLPEV